MNRAAAILAALALTTVSLGAQVAPKQFTVTTRVGILQAERAASLDPAAVIGLDAEYALSKYLGIGTTVDVSRGSTTKKDFLTRLRFGQAAVAGGDSIRYQYVGQPVNTVNLGLAATLRWRAS